ncbi:MAG: ATP-binding cassette domain-containing protein [Clostridia bacterium]|nr:ATP-binding cassette domain-containing protein [Clostridia bacterium]
MKELIILKNIVKSFKRQTVLDNISISVCKGEIFGIVGNNGAGKTTLLKIMRGLLAPNDGEIYRCDGIRVGSLISSPKLYGDMTAFENLKIFSISKGYKFSKEELLSVLENVGLSAIEKKLVSKFSTGMKQRLGIAFALVGNSDVLLLDEPFNGLDIDGIIDLRNLLLNLHEKYGTTIVISSHNLDELAKIITRLCIIRNGKLLVDAPASDIFEQYHDTSLENIYLALNKKSI